MVINKVFFYLLFTDKNYYNIENEIGKRKKNAPLKIELYLSNFRGALHITESLYFYKLYLQHTSPQANLKINYNPKNDE